MRDREYVLGTQDQEVSRLGLQHRVWRDRALEGWRRAGIGPRMTVIDVGAGPGFAAMDLAEMVGSEGKVIAVERSQRFLSVLQERARQLGRANVQACEQDVSATGFGDGVADAAWCRWLLSFVEDPARAVAHIAAALRPGGVAIFHEYADYGAWQAMPPNPDLDQFRELVMQSWRDAGGEPDVALRLPTWLREAGMELVSVRPLIDVIGRSDEAWQWPASFMAVNAERLRELGYASAEDAGRFARALDNGAADMLMITPLVVEVIARRAA